MHGQLFLFASMHDSDVDMEREPRFHEALSWEAEQEGEDAEYTLADNVDNANNDAFVIVKSEASNDKPEVCSSIIIKCNAQGQTRGSRREACDE